MAQLNRSRQLIYTAAAASAITATTGRKLARNFRYYKETSGNRVFRDELYALCRAIRSDVYSLHNLLMKEEPDEAPFWVSLAGQVYDQLEELHRNLLFFDAEAISEIIPIVDKQRAFWKHLTEPAFYSVSLAEHLEHSVPPALTRAERLIEQLPEHATG